MQQPIRAEAIENTRNPDEALTWCVEPGDGEPNGENDNNFNGVSKE
jgi:hypothetical protein